MTAPNPRPPSGRRAGDPHTVVHPDRVLRTKAVADLLGVSRATLWRWYSSGHFPSPMVLGQGPTRPVHGWRESEVLSWLAARPTLAEES